MGFTPFYDKIAAVANRGPRFFVPGHKGCPAAVPPFGPLLHWDLTEVEGACDLSHPAGELAQSQRNMARVFGSGATCYSAFGSTSCIMAMLALFVGEGGAVVMARGCHVSAVRALALLNVTPHWVPLQNGLPSPRAIDETLARSGAKAVYITSVDYYGNIPDIAAIAAACQKHGAALLCDNAHGAHLRFVQPNAHPLALGANATADSAHKTLPCLTPAALLHLRDAALAEKARAALNLFCSTSPSYPVLLSLDLAAGLLLQNPPDYMATARTLAGLAQGFPGLCAPCADPLRLVLRPAAAGFNAAAFNAGLLAAGIAAEYFDGDAIVLMASPFNSPADFDTLSQALSHLQATLPRVGGSGQTPAPGPANFPLPKTACGLRTALFGPSQTLPVASAAGRVMAGLHAPCPPGVPLVLPGEVIDEAMAARLAAGGILQVDVLK